MAFAVFRSFLCAIALPAAFASNATPIVAEPLPDLRISGFHFPESEATLTSWISTMSRGPVADAAAATEKIQLHGWGLWTALTAETNQLVGGQRLRVFETWLTPDDLTSASPARERAALRQVVQLRTRAEEIERPELLADDQPSARVLGFTKFDPTAAGHVASQELLNLTSLNTLLQGGAQGIPPFPAASLAVKPLFQVITAASLVEGRYYALKVWPGPPDTPRAWGPTQWPGCVWLDLLGGGNGRGAMDEATATDGSTRTDDTTYPLADIIHYRLSAADAIAVNAEKPGTNAAAGDTAIMVAMHVSSRETARWTWQTFWWSPTPEDPHAPSSPAIAAQRPAQLRGAARNYAMALAYTMLAPDQPYVGGENSGAAVYAYNPWIEARFTPADLPDSLSGAAPDGRPAANNYGVQSNCMSCHARATYNPQKLTTAPRFSGARYVDLIDPQFVGTLQVDFLWSVARHAK